MGTATAIIIAGGAHPNDGGILPAATLTLWENDRPAWRCDHIEGDRPSVAWVPRAPETFLEDGLVMLAAVSIRDERVTQLLDDRAGEQWKPEQVDMREVLADSDDELRAAVATALQQAKLVVTVLREASIHSQLHQLEALETDIEVCLPADWRLSNQWQSEPEIGGQLP